MRTIKLVLLGAVVAGILGGCGSSAPADTSTTTVDKSSPAVKDK